MLGVTVRSRNAPASQGLPSDVDTAFVAGHSTTGTTTEAVPVRSLGDLESEFGSRATANALLYDWVDAFLSEGGQTAYVGLYGSSGPVDDAFSLFDPDKGPGLLAAPYETPGGATYAKLLDTAAATQRFALMDYDVGDSITEMTALAGAVPAQNADYGMLAGQWANIPGPRGVIGGSARQAPGSAVTAALISRAVRLGNPNRAAAGRDFPLQYVTSFTTEVKDSDRETLLNLGANTFATKGGVLQLYGFQTVIDQSVQTPFWQANCSIARMWLQWKCKERGEHYMFKTIDGQGRLEAALKKELDAVCLELYEVDGLFGATPDEAFATSTSTALNTTSTIAQGELHGSVEAVLSEHAKAVVIDLVSVPVSGRVSTATS